MSDCARGADHPDANRGGGTVAIEPSAELAEQKVELESFLYDRVYRHPQLIDVRTQAQRRLRVMFDGYLKQFELLPAKYQRREASVGRRRAVGEYLAGMTDRFCESQYRSYFAEQCGG